MSFDPTPFTKPSPPRAIDAEPGFTRLEPLITPREIRKQFLFGMKLKSVMTGEEMEDPDIQAQITRAISRVEHGAKIHVSPVKFKEPHDYSTWDYQKWNFIQLNHWPIHQIESFRAKYPFSEEFIEFPTDWIACYNDFGYVQLVPKSGSFSQFLITRDASLLPLILGGRMRWPQLFEVTYVAGFEVDKVPAIINELVGTYASMEILRMLDSIVFLGSHSINIDGVSQGVTLPNPGWLRQRVADLDVKAKELLDTIRRYYNQQILVSAL